MTGRPLEVTTEEQRERLHTARNQGGQCAACGRVLRDEETVYVERFLVEARRPSYADAPVGIECASTELLEETARREPERCAGCGRSVHYRAGRKDRRQALCSKPCAGRATAARRSAKTGEAG